MTFAPAKELVSNDNTFIVHLAIDSAGALKQLPITSLFTPDPHRTDTDHKLLDMHVLSQPYYS